MEIVDLIPVFLICQHLGKAYGNFVIYDERQPLRPLDLSLLSQLLPQIDQPQRQRDLSQQPLIQPQYPLSPLQQPFSPFQQPNPQYQPLSSPFQQPNPHQQPFSPFQQAFSPFQQLFPPLSQPYLPYQHQYRHQPQPHRPFQQQYPAMHQLTDQFNNQPTQLFQHPICPQPTPICVDGRPAVCTSNAFTGSPVHNCPNGVLQNGFPSASGFPGVSQYPLVNPALGEANHNNTTGPESGARSHLESFVNLHGENVSWPSDNSSTTKGQSLGVSAREADSPLTTNGPYYPLNGPPCSFKTPQAGCSSAYCCLEKLLFPIAGSLPNQASGPFGKPCKPGQSGCLPDFPTSPWNQAYYKQPNSPTQFSGMAQPSPYGSLLVGAPSADSAQPAVTLSNLFSSLTPTSTYSSQTSNTPSNLQDSRKKYLYENRSVQNVIPSATSQLFGRYFPTIPQVTGTNMVPGLQVPPYIGSGLYPSNPQTPLDQTALEAQLYQSQPKFSSGPGISLGPYQNFANFKTSQLAMAQHSFRNPFFQGDFGYQVPEKTGSIQGVQSPLQPDVQSDYQLFPAEGFSQPLIQSPTPRAKIISSHQQPSFNDSPSRRNFPSKHVPQGKSTVTRKKSRHQNKNNALSQNVQKNRRPSYLPSGLSLSSILDEGPPDGEKQIVSQDKTEFAPKPAKKTKRARKPNRELPHNIKHHKKKPIPTP